MSLLYSPPSLPNWRSSVCSIFLHTKVLPSFSISLSHFCTKVKSWNWLFLLVGWVFLLLKNILLLMDLVNAKARCIKLTLHTLAMAARDFRHRSGSRLRGGVRWQRCVLIYDGTDWHLCLGYNVNRKMGREKKYFLTCIWHLFPGWSPEQDRPKQVDHK